MHPKAPEEQHSSLAAQLLSLGVVLLREPELPSTSDCLKGMLADRGLSGPTLLLTANQTAGRGTRGRDWQMEAGRDLAMTLALPLEQAAQGGDGLPDARLPLVAAAAVAVALSQAQPRLPAIGLRWPNDLLLIPPVAKLCGLLLESSRGWLLCGVGLNVNSRRNLPDSSAEFRSCSLRDAAGSHFELDSLASLICTCLMRSLCEAHGIDHWLREWSFRDVSAGGRYLLRREGQELNVVAQGVDLASGGLQLVGDDGAEFLVLSYQELERLV
jgi:BirA family biotin operon repressor/biotin-[acetyl-CoA-carboxylase] ligase